MLANIDQFTEEELMHLNHIIVQRVKLMQQIRAHQSMVQFRVGQRVGFTASCGHRIVGTLSKYNRKSVTIVADTGQIWNVAPALLKAENSTREDGYQ